jgi:hypothetical protein
MEIVKKDGVKEKKIGKQDPLDAEINGFGAEMALAKFLNVYPDFTLTKEQGAPDLWVSYGEERVFRVDVKHTVYGSGKLIAPRWKKPEDTDLYVLVTGRMPEFTIVGWAWAEELLLEENLRDFGYGDQGLCYSMVQSKLHTFDKERTVNREAS